MIVPVIIILGLGAANPAPCRTELKLLKCTEIIDIGVVAGVHPVYPPSQNSISGRRVRALFHVTFNPMPLPKRYGYSIAPDVDGAWGARSGIQQVAVICSKIELRPNFVIARHHDEKSMICPNVGEYDLVPCRLVLPWI